MDTPLAQSRALGWRIAAALLTKGADPGRGTKIQWHSPILLLTKGVHHQQRLVQKKIQNYTSSTAQGGGGSFKNRKPIGEVGWCESGMAERSHWWTERCLRSPLFLSLSLTTYLPTYQSTNLSIYLSFFLSFYLSIYLSIYLSFYLSIYLSISLSLSFICLSV